MRAPYRQEQGCGKADAQRNKQEPEAVRNPAPVLAVLALSGRRMGIATDIRCYAGFAGALHGYVPCGSAPEAGFGECCRDCLICSPAIPGR